MSLKTYTIRDKLSFRKFHLACFLARSTKKTIDILFQGGEKIGVYTFLTFLPINCAIIRSPEGKSSESDKERKNKMKFKNNEVGRQELDEFLDVVNKCEKGVYLRSPEGDSFNLKSLFSEYIAIGRLLGEEGDNLELFCDSEEDEQRFMKFFSKHEDVL